MKLEVCVKDLASGIAAQKGDADRIELCMGLELGGLTPSMGLFLQMKELLTIPIFVLIRPREGNFCYSNEEKKAMLRDVLLFLKEGVAGLVIGALTDKGEIDRAFIETVLKRANHVPITFHRAFDEITNPFLALECLASIGVTRVLTSGLAPTAPQGIETLQALQNHIQQYQLPITLLAGGGITPYNAKDLLAIGLKELHGSFLNPANSKIDFSNNRTGIAKPYNATDADWVRQVKNIMHKEQGEN